MLRGLIGPSRATQRRRVSPWTKQRTRVLRRRLAQGARVRDIAAELGHGITYNAVIGKIHRLGISELSPYGGAPGRRSAANTRSADRPVHAPRVAWWFRKGPPPAWVVDAKPYVETVDADARIPRRLRRSLFELNDQTCRWPVGDPRSSRLFFCGAQPLRNKPYCAAHCARAYRHLRQVPQRVSAPRLRHAARDADRSVMPSSKTAPQRRSTGERR
jgi:GcrA cell cycle regulator